MGRFFRRGLGGGSGPRRMMRRALMGRPVRPEIQREIMRANQMLSSGQPLPAAEIFSRLSDVVEKAGVLQRASHLAMRSAISFLDGRDAGRALTQFRRAVHLALLAGEVMQGTHMARASLAALSERGYSHEATTLKSEFNQQLKQVGASIGAFEPATAALQRGTLPAECPACLGPVRSDEIEWIDDHSAECAFCGSILHTQDS